MNYREATTLLGPHGLGSPMCSLQWELGLPQPSPSPSRVKVSGADHSIPNSRGGPGRQPAGPLRITAMPGGVGTCTREDRREG